MLTGCSFKATHIGLKEGRSEGSEANVTQAEAGESGAKVRFPPPLVYLVSILLGVAIRYAAAPLAVVAYRYLSLTAGVAVLMAGLGLITSAWTLFRRTGQDPKPWKPTPEIVLSGPYRFTRNPMCLGLTCIQIGLGLALNNLWISLLAAFSLLAVHFIAVLPEHNNGHSNANADAQTQANSLKRNGGPARI